MSIEIAEQLAQFAELGNQQRVYLASGQMLQGWIMEINDSALMMSTGFGEKNGHDQWVEFADIDLTRLEYWNNQASKWQQWTMLSK
ncbi:MAG: hypothetical protein EOO68_07685 [Moraxellaceae bacterium]|nr:MAG: hypothetical protein EOO68_07685 [Moraxellaceae bacterium]